MKGRERNRGTRTFKPDTKGVELVSDMKMVSDNIFVKTKAKVLTSGGFAEFIEKNGINDFFVAGADATGCPVDLGFGPTVAETREPAISLTLKVFLSRSVPGINPKE